MPDLKHDEVPLLRRQLAEGRLCQSVRAKAREEHHIQYGTGEALDERQKLLSKPAAKECNRVLMPPGCAGHTQQHLDVSFFR